MDISKKGEVIMADCSNPCKGTPRWICKECGYAVCHKCGYSGYDCKRCNGKSTMKAA